MLAFVPENNQIVVPWVMAYAQAKSWSLQPKNMKLPLRCKLILTIHFPSSLSLFSFSFPI